jgi:hypothetical protein
MAYLISSDDVKNGYLACDYVTNPCLSKIDCTANCCVTICTSDGCLRQSTLFVIRCAGPSSFKIHPSHFQTCDLKLTDILIAGLRCNHIVEPAIKEHSSKGTTSSPHCASEDSPKMTKERFALPSSCATKPRFRRSPPPPIKTQNKHARTEVPTIPSIPRHSMQTESHRFFPSSPTSVIDRHVVR